MKNQLEIESRTNRLLTLYVQGQDGCWQQLHTFALDHPTFDEFRQPLCFALELEQSAQLVLPQEPAETCGVIPQ